MLNFFSDLKWLTMHKLVVIKIQRKSTKNTRERYLSLSEKKEEKERYGCEKQNIVKYIEITIIG